METKGYDILFYSFFIIFTLFCIAFKRWKIKILFYIIIDKFDCLFNKFEFIT
jgi:hypothetical protein